MKYWSADISFSGKLNRLSIDLRLTVREFAFSWLQAAKINLPSRPMHWWNALSTGTIQLSEPISQYMNKYSDKTFVIQAVALSRALKITNSPTSRGRWIWCARAALGLCPIPSGTRYQTASVRTCVFTHLEIWLSLCNCMPLIDNSHLRSAMSEPGLLSGSQPVQLPG